MRDGIHISIIVWYRDIEERIDQGLAIDARIPVAFGSINIGVSKPSRKGAGADVVIVQSNPLCAVDSIIIY